MNEEQTPKKRRTRDEFMNYAVVGGSSFAIDVITLTAIKEIFAIPAYIAVLINQAIVIVYNFTLNKHWTFKNKAMPHKQFVKYLAVYGFNYVVSFLFMYLFNERHGIHYLIVRTGTVMLSVSWNFLLYKYWVFGPKGTLYTGEKEGA